MITGKDKNRILKISFFAGRLHEFPETEIGVAESIVFFQACKSGCLVLSGRNIFKFEFTEVLLWNRKWPMIIRCLNYCKEGFCIFCEDFIRFEKQIFIAYPPNINLWHIETFLFKDFDSINIII